MPNKSHSHNWWLCVLLEYSNILSLAFYNVDTVWYTWTINMYLHTKIVDLWSLLCSGVHWLNYKSCVIICHHFQIPTCSIIPTSQPAILVKAKYVLTQIKWWKANFSINRWGIPCAIIHQNPFGNLITLIAK